MPDLIIVAVCSVLLGYWVARTFLILILLAMAKIAGLSSRLTSSGRTAD
jgi:uncharacterized membrane protein